MSGLMRIYVYIYIRFHHRGETRPRGLRNKVSRRERGSVRGRGGGEIKRANDRGTTERERTREKRRSERRERRARARRRTAGEEDEKERRGVRERTVLLISKVYRGRRKSARPRACFLRLIDRGSIIDLFSPVAPALVLSPRLLPPPRQQRQPPSALRLPEESITMIRPELLLSASGESERHSGNNAISRPSRVGLVRRCLRR